MCIVTCSKMDGHKRDHKSFTHSQCMRIQYISNLKKDVDFRYHVCVAFNHFGASASSLIMMMTRKLIKLTSSIWRNEKCIFRNSSYFVHLRTFNIFSLPRRVSLLLFLFFLMHSSSFVALIFPYIFLISFLISISMENLPRAPFLLCSTALRFTNHIDLKTCCIFQFMHL